MPVVFKIGSLHLRFHHFVGFFAALPLIWREDLLCSDRNLFIAILDSTTFCQIQGM